MGKSEYQDGCLKIGKWIELSDFFDDLTQVTYEGNYHNGKKINKWNINFRQSLKKPFEQIGGGQYDEQGNENKIGNWIELHDGFDNLTQVTYEGEYNNGKKVNRWNIYYEKNQIGGGSYAQDGNKVGMWNEVSDDFRHSSQIFLNGEYKNGKKIGIWNIYYQDSDANEKQKIGGGQYDEEGNENKIGKWFELSEGFNRYSQIIYNGEYKNNKKVNKWEIQMRDKMNENFEKIGEGSYDEGGTGFKIGEWKEFSDFPWKNKQLISSGLYQNNRKVGIWIETDLKNKEHHRDINYDN
ncbi:unnamed protein product [Paramecium octaurelia]|uniref:MORN repeat protein n=1 Tax=Paramecium octaurelia TaxID=43137 RepID=A0A8S1VA53_PAROT|nr:unnamed protein product [Paramecium octaurelia]